MRGTRVKSRLAGLHLAVVVAVGLALPLAARAGEIKAPPLSAPDSWEPRQKGTVRVMNKIDSTVKAVTIDVGATATIQSLSIKLSGCFVRPADLPADAAAHLIITDRLALQATNTAAASSGAAAGARDTQAADDTQAGDNQAGDNQAGAHGSQTPVFDGWMLQKEPALNMLEHPVYDVQLASCG